MYIIANTTDDEPVRIVVAQLASWMEQQAGEVTVGLNGGHIIQVKSSLAKFDKAVEMVALNPTTPANLYDIKGK